MEAEARNEAGMGFTPENGALRPTHSRRPVVLFAMYESGRPTLSLMRAAALARVLEADLHVMRVLPERPRVNPLFPQHNLADAVGTVESTVRVDRSTRAWLRACLGRRTAAGVPTVIAHGAFVSRVVEHATALEAVLIVVPPRKARLGHLVTSLASAACVPVLVAREATRGDTIIAATDLESPEYPVLSRAARLGQRLDAPVVAVHNLTPMSLAVPLDPTVPPAVLLENPIQEVRSAHLSQVAERLAATTHPVVRTEVDPVDAILAEARACDADLVVVGTHRRSWLNRLLRGSIAAQVVNRAKRSVLVTPLTDSGEVAGPTLVRA